MSDRTKGSDPDHLQFWHNCLPNEEQMEKHKKIKYFSKKLVHERKDNPKQITQWSKKRCIRLMRYANIKKASQDERQNQTTTTNINDIKKFVSVLKNKT